MKKYSLVMKTRDYFILKNYFVQLKQSGKFDNDPLLMKFYKAFAINASIEIPRHLKTLNDNCIVMFYMKEDRHLLAEVGLFCYEHSLDLKSTNADLSQALEVLKNHIASELMILIG